MTVSRAPRVVLDLDLELQRVEDTRSVQKINVSTSSDDAIFIASTGVLPKRAWQDLRRLKIVAVTMAWETGQDIVLQHNGTVLTKITAANQPHPTVSIRWWAVAREALFDRR